MEFFPHTEIIQAGALDELTDSGIGELAPADGSDVLVSRLKNGTWVTLAESKIIPLLQQRAAWLCSKKADLILLFCTGKFPDVLTAAVPVIYPQQLLYRLVPLLACGRRIGIVNPDRKQLDQCRRNWGTAASDIVAVAMNPYDDADVAGMDVTAGQLKDAGAGLVVMDCIGYTRAMKEKMQRLTGIPVVLPRTLLARIASELL